MFIVTTDDLPGNTHQVKDVLGAVHVETILCVHIGKDIWATIAGVFGGRSALHEEELSNARRLATEQLELNAREMGADAVVGVSYSFTVFGRSNPSIAVIAVGTAVTID